MDVEELESIAVHELVHFSTHERNLFVAANDVLVGIIQNGGTDPSVKDLMKHQLAMHVELEFNP